MVSSIRHSPVASYFALSYLISWGGSLAVGGPKFLRGTPLTFDDGMRMAVFMLAGPCAAGIVLTASLDGRRGLRDLLGRMLEWRVGGRWYAAALLTFPLLVLGVLWALTFVSQEFRPGRQLAFGVFGGLAAGVFEEIGWTGFAFPRMERAVGVWRATIYLAVLHGVWHAMPGYLAESGIYGDYWLPRFIAMWIVAMAAMRVLLVWIYTRTGSLLLAQLTHASSTGCLIMFGPPGLPPGLETLWFAVYAGVLWIPATLLIATYGRTLGQQPQEVKRRRAPSPVGFPYATRSVRADQGERTRALPGDDLIPQPIASLTNAITIHRPPRHVWPWLVQMGAGSRAGWYSYDVLDNGRRPSARHIVPELQRVTVGMIFPARPGVTEGFTVLAVAPERSLVLGWVFPDGTPMVTWAFVLEALGDQGTRLLVRARAGSGYQFHGLPLWLIRVLVPLLHLIMERKQLIGIAQRAESTGTADTSSADFTYT